MTSYFYMITILILLSGCGGLADETLVINVPTTHESAQQITSEKRVTDVGLLGLVIIGPGHTFEGTRIGGLSAVAYDANTGDFLFLTDDTRVQVPSRVYAASIDITDGAFAIGDLLFKNVITLERPSDPPDVRLDPEGIVLTHQGNMIIASEGILKGPSPSPPMVAEFTGSGEYVRSFPLPPAYRPSEDRTFGMRRNRGLESLTLTPDGQFLFTATEHPLAQDGQPPDLDHGAPVRILQFDLESGEPVHEYIYLIDPVAAMPNVADGAATNGLVELVALDNAGTFLALERSYSEGTGVTAKLFELKTKNALDVNGLDGLHWEAEDIGHEAGLPVTKRLLLDSTDLIILASNYEGMVLGPTLDDGRQTLLLVSDNAFSAWQPTLVVALALTIESESDAHQPASQS